MELTYWSLVFTNGQEYIVQTKVETVDGILDALGDRGTFLKDRGYICLRKTETSEPLIVMVKNLFTVQKVLKSSLSSQTKTWSLL